MSNFTINKKGTVIGKAVDLDQVFSHPLIKLGFFCLWLAGIASAGLILDHYTLQYIEAGRLFGLAFILFSVFLFYLAERSFYMSKIKHPHIKSPEEINDSLKSEREANIYDSFSFELAKSTKNIFDGQPGKTPQDLAAAILQSKDLLFLFTRLGLSPATLAQNLSSFTPSCSIDQIIAEALEISILEGHHQIEVGDVFAALCKMENFFKNFLKNLKLNLDDILNIVYWQTHIMRQIAKEKQFLEPSRLKLTGGIGRDWAFGWTPFLKHFSVDITNQVELQGLGLELIGHDKELNELKEALLSGNAILVGEPGIGKKTTIFGFAKKVAEGETFSPLDFHHIIKIDIDYVIAGLVNPGEITERINGIFNEAISAGNIIIYIENIQNMLSSGDAGKVDATEVLLPFLEHPNTHVIASCDVASYNQYIAPNTSLSSRLAKITMEEPDEEELIRILEDTVPYIEAKSGSFFSYEALKEIIKAADRYILNAPNPEKSIGLLDGVAAHTTSKRGKSIILAADVDSYISLKYNIPSGDADEAEKEKLLNLESALHQSVIGQSEAINAISNALRRARAGVTASKKPIGSFMFLGPTGVGKTETAKALAKCYFGAEDRMIRFDMSEFQNQEDIYRFIGSNIAGDKTQGVLTTAVREHPFSLLLFDEIEKAYRDILDLFLQILDEGILTDGLGRKVSFANSIIICTSNAGANLIRQSIQGGADYERVKKELLDYLQKENIYRPEFLNRFNSVIAFSPLSQVEITQVAELMIANLKKTMHDNKGIDVDVEPKAIVKLAELGYDPQMGARPMARVIQEKVENFLATKILSGQLNQGDSIIITEADLQ